MKLGKIACVPVLLLSLLCGCASFGARSAQDGTASGVAGPAPHRTITNFTDGLRCMDDLTLRFGTRDVSVMLEEMEDKTGKLGRSAIGEYGRGIGARNDGRVDLAYFTEFLQAKPPAPPAEPFTVANVNASKLGELKVEMAAAEAQFGAPLELKVKSTADAYVYCYSQGENGKVQRVFPNRFARDPRIKADETLELPGKLPFTLRANASGATHKLACISASREIYGGLPPPLRWSDFEDIGFTNFEDIRQAFANAAKAPINMAEVSVKLPETAPPPGALPAGIEIPGLTPPRIPRLPTAPRAGTIVPAK
jgi:hypothetical protein